LEIFSGMYQAVQAPVSLCRLNIGGSRAIGGRSLCMVQEGAVMAVKTRFNLCAGVFAAASMSISPASAAEAQSGLPGLVSGQSAGAFTQFGNGLDASIYDSEAQTAEWRGRRGWGRGWGRRGWRGGRRGVRGGDVLAGVLVLGGIAAIASAASNNNRRRDRDVVVIDRNRDNPRYDDRRDDRRFDDRRDNRQVNPRASGGSGIDNAVSQCVREIEQDVRVDSVDGASRTAQGWIVSGALFNGSDFTCQIGNDGRIDTIDYGNFSGASYDGAGTGDRARGDDRQWTDSSYADARTSVGGKSPVINLAQASQNPEPLPAYPGGPLPGEEFDSETGN
jgi:hypothetical protein